MKIVENYEFLPNIVLSPAFTSLERYAAGELQKYVSLCCKNEVGIDFEGFFDEKASKSAIHVGMTEELKNKHGDIISTLGYDSYAVIVEDDVIFLSGNPKSGTESGTLYAVYGFLERYFGVRFYSYDEEKTPKCSDLEIENGERIEIPDFEMRCPLTADMRIDPTFTAKLRVKDPFTQNIPGGSVFPTFSGSLGHNYFNLIPPKVYQTEHPEWFDMQNSQLCYSDDGLVDKLVEVLKCRIAAAPSGKFFALSQNDTVTPCQCEKCKAAYEKYGVSGTMIRFLNKVAVRIDEWVKATYPEREVYLVSFAYYFTFKPPVKTDENGKIVPLDQSVVPAKNVYIFFTTIDFCFYHALDDQNCEWNKDFRFAYDGWRAICDKFMVWSYATNFAYYLYPFWNFDTMSRNYKLFKQMGAKLFLDQGACESKYVQFSELRSYLGAKMMWDSDVDVYATVKEFVEAYYDVGSGDVLEYMEILKNHLASVEKSVNYHLRLYHLPDEMFDVKTFPLETVQKMTTCFENALKKADKISDPDRRKVVKTRLTRASMSPKFLLLMNYSEYGLENKEKFEQEFMKECFYCGITKYKEAMGKENISELIALSQKNEVKKY